MGQRPLNAMTVVTVWRQQRKEDPEACVIETFKNYLLKIACENKLPECFFKPAVNEIKILPALRRIPLTNVQRNEITKVKRN